MYFVALVLEIDEIVYVTNLEIKINTIYTMW